MITTIAIIIPIKPPTVNPQQIYEPGSTDSVKMFTGVSLQVSICLELEHPETPQFRDLSSYIWHYVKLLRWQGTLEMSFLITSSSVKPN